jgi:beta-lactamase superfamily II metal-dependent hydrolase
VATKFLVKQIPGEKRRETMSAERWMQTWQIRFAPLGVEIVVADVGQSSVFLDMAERKVVLAPSLNVENAEKMLVAVLKWWRCQPEEKPIACAVT